MIESDGFLKSVLDTITEQVTVIDSKGHILFTNRSWRAFGEQNTCLVKEGWNGINYLEECEKAAAMGDHFGLKAAEGIQSVIRSEKNSFYFEYPCHSPDEKRWFMMRVHPFFHNELNYYVISHQNITERKLAEEEVLALSTIDGLTDIANRRRFNEFLKNEWRRCNRLGTPISLAMVDLDYFKLLNDTYGHQVGDECLSAIGKILKRYCKRPNDMCARYGGEEFTIVYSGTGLEQAKVLVRRMLHEISMLEIPNEKSPILPTLTASIGIAEMYPSQGNSEKDLIEKSDKLLYLAKQSGRNRISFDTI